jgi:hypothetical protein
MNAQQETDAFILLADISGYTSFLRQNTLTLRHASYIISELLGAVIKRAEAPLSVNKLEGDAALFVAPVRTSTAAAVESIRGSAFGFFSAFSRRRAELVASNTCPCEACSSIGRLELKVIGHFGRAVRFKLKRFDEYAGIDVILVHRLLKNNVKEKRYFMATEAAWRQLKPQQELAFLAHVEDCDGVGQVPVVVLTEGWENLSEDISFQSQGLRLKKIADFLVKHLMLLPFGGVFMQRGARKGTVRPDSFT